MNMSLWKVASVVAGAFALATLIAFLFDDTREIRRESPYVVPNKTSLDSLRSEKVRSCDEFPKKPNVALADPGVIGMVTGGKTGTYYPFGNNIAAVAHQQSPNLKIFVRETNGSLDNLRLLQSRDENATLGIAQSDVLIRARNSGRIAHLRVIASLYDEEVHLFAGKHIRSIEDLTDARVNVGPKGSGTRHTAGIILAKALIRPAGLLSMSPSVAVNKVVNGGIDATFYVVGKPAKRFDFHRNAYSLIDARGVHFVELKSSLFAGLPYTLTKITANDYGWMTAPVRTLAVKAMLVAYNYDDLESEYQLRRCSEVRRITDALEKNIKRLKRCGHPKWKSVRLAVAVPGWKPHDCVNPSNEKCLSLGVCGPSAAVSQVVSDRCLVDGIGCDL